MKMLFDGPADSTLRVALAHGAGKPMDSPLLTALAEGLAAAGARVARFEFPYMEARRRDQSERPPDRFPVLMQRWRDAIIELGDAETLVIGGHSMGGRFASMVADEMRVAGVVCFSYPFHPPEQPEVTRVAHLEHLRTRALIVQGTRDPFGTPSDVEAYALSRRIRVEWIDDADHSLGPTRRADENVRTAVDVTARFLTRKVRKRRHRP